MFDNFFKWESQGALSPMHVLGKVAGDDKAFTFYLNPPELFELYPIL